MSLLENAVFILCNLPKAIWYFQPVSIPASGILYSLELAYKLTQSPEHTPPISSDITRGIKVDRKRRYKKWCAENMIKWGQLREPVKPEHYEQLKRNCYKITQNANPDEERKLLEDLVKQRLIETGNLRESRLWYLTRDQCINFAKMTFNDVENPNSNSSREIALLEDVLKSDDFQSLILDQNFDLMDIGCGNGGKASVFFRHTIGGARYTPVDISPYMIAIALNTVGRNFAVDLESDFSAYDSMGVNSRIHTSTISPLLLRYVIHKRRRDIKRCKKHLNKLLNDKKLIEYYSVINNDPEFAFTLSYIRDKVNDFEKIDQSLDEIVKKLKTYDKKELLEAYHNITGKNFSIMFELEDSIIDALKVVSLFYVARTMQMGMLWPIIALDYIVGKLTNIRVSEEHCSFAPYWYGNIKGSKDIASRIYAFRQSLRSLFWPKKEKALTQLRKIFQEVKLIEDKESRWYEIYNMNLISFQGGLITDLQRGKIDKLICDLTYKRGVYNKKRVYLFLGQTLGNFSAVERRELVDKFYKTMSSGDLMLIGVELRPDEKTENFEDHIRLIEKNYSNGGSFLAPILEASGINPQDVEYQATYNRTTNEIEIGYRIIADQVIIKGEKTSRLDKLLRRKEESRIFRKGEIISIASSHKFAVNESRSLFEHSGFNIIGHKTYDALRSNPDGTVQESSPEYEVLLVQKV